MPTVTNRLLLQTTKPREFIDITHSSRRLRRLLSYTERLRSGVFQAHHRRYQGNRE